MSTEMTGVRDGEDGFPELDRNQGGRWIVRASTEGGQVCTEVDLLDLLSWLKNNRPDLLNTALNS